MLNDRQLTEYKNKDLEDQLYSSNELINRLKHDLMKKDQHILEKNKEINALEGKLTKKQMSYDQLIEDYKDYQNTSKNEFEKISNLLEKEISKYEKLNDLSTKTQYQNMIKIKDLEERIRDLEVENQKYAEQYQKINDEKNELLQSINDFTERMSFSFSPKNVEATSLTK
jgi:chromosome segregation ATPase